MTPALLDPLTSIMGAYGPDLASLLPPLDRIPAEFKRGETKWCQFQRDWFFRGLRKLALTPKPGIDKGAALGHLKAIQASFEPSHEHKEAAVAYLASLWFEDVSYEVEP